MGHDRSSLDAVLAPVAEARGLPNAHYIDPDVFAEEREALLFSQWMGIGFGKDVPNPGDAAPIEVLGVPLLLVRSDQGDLRVFQNTCRHRGMILVEQKGNIRGTIRCPYHSWCYGLDGRLRSTPHVGGPGQNLHENIKRDDLGLIEIRSAIFRDVVFVNIDGTAPAFAEYVQPLRARWAEQDQPLYHGGEASSFTFDVQTNWKLAVENFCESYHLPWIHPGLNSYSRLEDHYHIEEPGHFSGQGTRVYRQIVGEDGARFPDFKGLSAFWDAGAEYVALYPNVLFGAQRDHAFAIVMMPQSVEHTIEYNEIYYPFDPAERPDLAPLIAENARLWKGVLEEDLFVVAGMQKGRHGPYFDGGKFSPVMDSPTHLFHAWAAGRIAEHRSRTLAAE